MDRLSARNPPAGAMEDLAPSDGSCGRGKGQKKKGKTKIETNMRERDDRAAEPQPESRAERKHGRDTKRV